ncbi:YegP family protein [Galbibacter mesophilus]|uniref:YegP family protein n=1 Tax=Galbibacter mesophilus TaxID=379069 RepID=UPI00191DD3B0|nr:YegP family protein [Galbibacter mesophilus]MCM5662156.1 YegP family protein [Galbibacter mesophilus]
MGMFVISKRKNGHFKFVFTSRKGKTIFTSIGCQQKSDCKVIINAIRQQPEMFTFTRKSTPSGKHFFRLSKGGLVLATSRKYSTPRMLEKGIDEIVKYVAAAETLDFSENEDVFAEEEASESL